MTAPAQLARPPATVTAPGTRSRTGDEADAETHVSVPAMLGAGIPPALTTPATPAPTAGQVAAELAEADALVAKLSARAPANPRDYALNTLRGVAERLSQDEKVLAGRDEPAADRVRALRATFAPVLAGAEQWHAANPAGESLGMMNERWRTSLAGIGERHYGLGGWRYLSGTAAYAGAAGVAVADFAERLLSFGFHDAATAVSQAYEHGDISWNQGGEIVQSAGWRALLAAAVTAALSPAFGRLGGAAATRVGFAPLSLGAGALSGAVAGGLLTTGSLSTEALLTAALRDRFSGGAAGVWEQGMPSGTDWAVGVPLSMVIGAGLGVRGMRLHTQRLVGTTFDTSLGRQQVVAISPDGQVIVSPAGSQAAPAPPPATIEMVYDPATGNWASARSQPAQLPAGEQIAGEPTASPMRITASHGTNQGFGGGRIDVGHTGGADQDFGQGFYLATDRPTAEMYAERRHEQYLRSRPGEPSTPRVFSFDIPLEPETAVVDIRPNGNFRTEWEKFLTEPPYSFPAGMPIPPGLESNRVYLNGLGTGQRGRIFEKFLQRIGMQEADMIIGPLGDNVFSGIVGEQETVQICIRSQALADRLSNQLGGDRPPPAAPTATAPQPDPPKTPVKPR